MKEQDIPTIPELEALNAKLAKAINQAATSTTQEDRNKFLSEAKALKAQLSSLLNDYKTRYPFNFSLRKNLAKEFNLDYVGMFHDGWATVQQRVRGYNKANYINQQGELLFDSPQRVTFPFSERIGRTIDEQSLVFYVKDDRSPFVKFRPNEGTDFSEGRAAFAIGNSWGFLNNTKEKVTPLDYSYAYPFSEGAAAVQKQKFFHFIKTDYKLLFPPYKSFYSARPFSDGLAAVRPTQADYFSYIDHQGQTILQTKSSNVRSFSEGLALTMDELFQSRYINKQGKSPFHDNLFLFANDFSEGVAIVNDLEGKYVAINQKNETVLNLSDLGFHLLRDQSDYKFKEGVLKCAIDDQVVYIDKQGRIIFREESIFKPRILT